MPPEDKNAAPRRRRRGPFPPAGVGCRPRRVAGARSTDRKRGREPEPVLSCRGGLVGPGAHRLGPPPLETEHGWLVVYHGVRQTVSGGLYRADALAYLLSCPPG